MTLLFLCSHSFEWKGILHKEKVVSENPWVIIFCYHKISTRNTEYTAAEA